MHYFQFAEKHSTLYQASSSLNAGLDEVLEVRKDVSPTGLVVNSSRILVKFDLSYISKSVSDNVITNPKYYLNLFDAKPTALATSQSLFAYPVSQSWTMGEGRSYDNPTTTEGCSWIFRDGKLDGKNWNASVSASGGTFFTASAASHSFTKDSIDMRMDVTDIVNGWLTGNKPNEGFMVKRSGSAETDNSHLGNFSFFSTDTHTKYPPTLEVQWDDSNWSTGSLSALSSNEMEDMVVYMKGLRPEYHGKSKVKFRLVGRSRYPEKTYSTTPSNLTVKTLPSGSTFYSILDAETLDVVVPFGSGSKVSCDSTGNYFNLWLDGYQPERYYSLRFRVQSGSNTVEESDQYYDEGFTFKVTK